MPATTHINKPAHRRSRAMPAILFALGRFSGAPCQVDRTSRRDRHAQTDPASLFRHPSHLMSDQLRQAP